MMKESELEQGQDPDCQINVAQYSKTKNGEIEKNVYPKNLRI